jgi:hypothetical protein
MGCYINNLIEIIKRMIKTKNQNSGLDFRKNMITIHQIDSIYYGEINKSYQK